MPFAMDFQSEEGRATCSSKRPIKKIAERLMLYLGWQIARMFDGSVPVQRRAKARPAKNAKSGRNGRKSKRRIGVKASRWRADESCDSSRLGSENSRAS